MELVLQNILPLLKDVIPLILLIINLLGTYLIQKSFKKKESRQQNYQKAQVEKLQELYSIMVEFKFVNMIMFNTVDSDIDNEIFKRRIISWINKFVTVRNFYLKHRILFPLNICDKIDLRFNEMRELGLILKAKKTDIEENEQFEFENLDYWDEVDYNHKTINQILMEYNYLIAGIDDIISQIETDFRKII